MTKGVEDGMGAKQRVLAVYPDATIARDHHSAYYAFTRKGAGGRISEYVGSEELVWKSAASKLPKPAELELKGEGGDTLARAVCEEMIANLRHNVAQPSAPRAAVPVEERTQVDPRIYANPIYLAGLFKRIEGAYFDHEWKAVKRLFEAEIEEMQKRVPVPERTAEMEQLMGRESPEDAFRRGQELMRYNASRVATRYGTLIEAKDVANYPLFDYHAPLDHIEGKAKAVSQEVRE